MKFLADMGVSPLTVNKLKESGYDAVHLSDRGWFKMTDSEIMIRAKQESRIILTFDRGMRSTQTPCF